jgi:predicted DNA-binding transcriptional regulator YafY
MATVTTVRFLRTLLQLERGCKSSVTQLAKEFGVTRRTIFRYRAEPLSLAAAYPAEFGPKPPLPGPEVASPPPLTSREALALALAVQLSPLLKREGFADDIESGLAKVLTAISPQMRETIAQSAAEYRKRKPARYVSRHEHEVRAALVDVANRLPRVPPSDAGPCNRRESPARQ